MTKPRKLSAKSEAYRFPDMWHRGPGFVEKFEQKIDDALEALNKKVQRALSHLDDQIDREIDKAIYLGIQSAFRATDDAPDGGLHVAWVKDSNGQALIHLWSPLFSDVPDYEAISANVSERQLLEAALNEDAKARNEIAERLRALAKHIETEPEGEPQ